MKGREMKAIDIVKEYLEANNYVGLCNPADECGCVLSDLVPCRSDFSECILGKKIMRDDGDWAIVDAGLNPYYQAFLEDGGGENHEYMAWIIAKHREFRRKFDVTAGPYSEEIREQFEEWLTA